jgi:hypothetical protein
MSGSAKPSRPVTASEVVRLVGPLEDAVVARIIDTGATAAEVLEAFTWLTADDDLGTELERTRTGRVAQVYDILAPEFHEADEP